MKSTSYVAQAADSRLTLLQDQHRSFRHKDVAMDMLCCLVLDGTFVFIGPFGLANEVNTMSVILGHRHNARYLNGQHQ